MAKPLSRILVIEDEPLVLREIVHQGYQPCVRVVKPAEKRGLRRIG